MTQHPMHRVVSFAIVGPRELEVGFEDGIVRRINFLPVLEGGPDRGRTAGKTGAECIEWSRN